LAKRIIAKSVQYQMVQSFNEKKVSKVTCGWSHTTVITGTRDLH